MGDDGWDIGTITDAFKSGHGVCNGGTWYVTPSPTAPPPTTPPPTTPPTTPPPTTPPPTTPPTTPPPTTPPPTIPPCATDRYNHADIFGDSGEGVSSWPGDLNTCYTCLQIETSWDNYMGESGWDIGTITDAFKSGYGVCNGGTWYVTPSPTTPPPTQSPTTSVPPTLSCEDTPEWKSYDDMYTCADFENNGWCQNGAQVVDLDIGGETPKTQEQLNYPESNCCACGKVPLPNNETPVCRGHDSTVWAMCGDDEFKRWGKDPTVSLEQNIANCNYSYTQGTKTTLKCPESPVCRAKDDGTVWAMCGDDEFKKWENDPTVCAAGDLTCSVTGHNIANCNYSYAQTAEKCPIVSINMCAVVRPTKCNNPPPSPLTPEGGGSALSTSEGIGDDWDNVRNGCAGAAFWNRDAQSMEPSELLCRGLDIRTRTTTGDYQEAQAMIDSSDSNSGSPYMGQGVDYEWYRDCCQWGFNLGCQDKDCENSGPKKVACIRNPFPEERFERPGTDPDLIVTVPGHSSWGFGPGLKLTTPTGLISSDLGPDILHSGITQDIKNCLTWAPDEIRPPQCDASWTPSLMSDCWTVSDACLADYGAAMCLKECEDEPICKSFWWSTNPVPADPDADETTTSIQCHLYSERMYEESSHRDYCVTLDSDFLPGSIEELAFSQLCRGEWATESRYDTSSLGGSEISLNDYQKVVGCVVDIFEDV